MQLPTPIALQPKSVSRGQGFTLIELLLVIAIVGILSAMTLPAMIGIYNRTVLDNTANEIVTNIKLVQNMAISNDQEGYTGDEDELINDCMATKPYVENFVFKVLSGSGSYQPQREFKTENNAGVACPQPNGVNDIGITAIRTLPEGIHFASNDSSWDITYAAVTGNLTTSNPISPTDTTKTFYTLTSDHVSDLTYYICVTRGRVYAQQNTTCW